MKIKILDHGYIELTGTMISESEDKECAQSLDQMVVEAARVSYGGGLKGEEKDRKLLHYLLEHEHGTPFESPTFKFEVKLPIYVMRQWRTHRWGSFNEISGRYTEELAEDYYTPEIFRIQDDKNRQGSKYIDVGDKMLDTGISPLLFMEAELQEGYSMRGAYKALMENERAIYEGFLEAGLAKELARGVLGTAFYTRFIWTVNARSIMNFLILRCEKHAQWEIQQYAQGILHIFKEKMPWTAESMIKLFPSSF
jgi:thymidylate synthase (FAD)